MIVESRVGSKGELFLPKNLRKLLDFEPGDRIFFEVQGDILKIRKVPDLLDLLKLPRLGQPATPEEIEQEIEQMNEEQFKMSTDENE
ncbi:MAG TPA: AbrB/MazE/SpoVT family DNA-binding domain-containing protein [Candidatus Lokiarchaeia archaeon]|nr:AbrB/MazE/SpoVT family DNA-binding domain-containing protein [Candidatus Lokiarchaeia archaeon]